MDKNCKAMLFALIDLHNLYSNQDGWFFRSNQDLQYDTDLSQNLVKVVLDTLYRAGIINVFSVGQGKGHTSNRIHINFESFTRYEVYSFNDIRNNPDLHIKTLPYKDHFSPSYCEKVGDSESERVSETSSESIGEKMTTITDTIDTADTLNTSYSIDNITKDNNTKDNTLENTTNNEEKSPFESMLCNFIDKYPNINYSLNEQDFMSNYYQQLLEFQTFVRSEVQLILPLDFYSKQLRYYYYTGRVYEEDEGT